jgi:hypothetical protein
MRSRPIEITTFLEGVRVVVKSVRRRGHDHGNDCKADHGCRQIYRV